MRFIMVKDKGCEGNIHAFVWKWKRFTIEKCYFNI